MAVYLVTSYKRHSFGFIHGIQRRHCCWIWDRSNYAQFRGLVDACILFPVERGVDLQKFLSGNFYSRQSSDIPIVSGNKNYIHDRESMFDVSFPTPDSFLVYSKEHAYTGQS